MFYRFRRNNILGRRSFLLSYLIGQLLPNPNRSSRLKKRAVITAKIGIITKAMLQRIIIVLVVITAIIRKIVIIGINVADLISRPIGMDVIKIVMLGIIVRASVLMASIRSSLGAESEATAMGADGFASTLTG